MNSIVQSDLEAIIQEPLPWDALAGSHVLVTGAAGFLPAYMVETLMYLNRCAFSTPAKVTALVRNAERARKRFADYDGRSDLRIFEQDVSHPLGVSTPFDYIIHAASNASPATCLADPAGTIAANVLGMHHLLDAAVRSGSCRGFLFFSSGEVYGEPPPSSVPLAEHQGGYLNPTDLRSCYGESKRMGETMCACWAKQYGMPTRIVRPGHTYGPGMSLDDGRVFADFVRDILKGGPIVLLSDGSARRHFCYLADATAAYFTVLLKGGSGEAYNVVNPNGESSIAELADRLAAMYKDEGIYVERRQRPAGIYVPSPLKGVGLSVEKIGALGWHARTSIEEGFRRTIDSYREAASALGEVNPFHA